MSLRNKLAEQILLEYSKKLASDAYFHTLNSNLHDLAKKYNVELAPSVNLVSWAFKATHDAGGGDESEVIGIDAINQVVFKEKTVSEKEYSRGYVVSQILPIKVQQFKADGWSLEDIKNDPFFKNLMNKYSIAESHIAKCYSGLSKANKSMLEPKSVGTKKTAPRDNVFEMFDPHKDHDFLKYWISAIRNKANDIITHNYNSNHVLEESIRFVGERELEEGEMNSIDEGKLMHEEAMSRAEAKTMKGDLLSIAKKMNPHYETALKLICEGYELASKDDAQVFEKALHLDRIQLEKFREYFLKDLPKILKEVGIHNVSDGMTVFTASKRVRNVLMRYADQLVS